MTGRPAAGLWGLGGVLLLFAEAAWSLGARGFATVRAGLAPWEWAALVLLVVLFVWGEGVRALQRRWVPFVARRARAVEEEGVHLRVAAPLYVMGLVGGPRAVTLQAWLGTGSIVGAVFLVRALPEPWWGMVDLAVAAALAWGAGALVVALGRLSRSGPAAGRAGRG